MTDFDIEQPGDLLRAYQQRAKKRFGQHFLTDPRVLGRIADCAGVRPGDRVLEIGPGCGTLTWTMLRRGADVTAVEIDRDAAEFLREQIGEDESFTLVEGDALAIDWDALLGDARWKAVANLPYNVATEILFRLLERAQRFDRMALMFQKEVAERICASPGSKTYGGLTLMARLWADAEMAFTLGAGAFTPPPNVTSAVVVFTPVAGSRIETAKVRDTFRQLVEAAFKARRKTFPNAVKSAFARDRVREAMETLELSPKARPEELSFEDYAALAAALS